MSIGRTLRTQCSPGQPTSLWPPSHRHATAARAFRNPAHRKGSILSPTDSCSVWRIATSTIMNRWSSRTPWSRPSAPQVSGGTNCETQEGHRRSSSKARSHRTPPTAGWAASPWTIPATSPSDTASRARACIRRFATPDVYRPTPWAGCKPRRQSFRDRVHRRQARRAAELDGATTRA